MKTKLLVAILLMFTSYVGADLVEGIEGATQKEREIRWLWKYIGEFSRSCARSGVECRDSEVSAVVDRLNRQLPLVPPTTDSAWGQRLSFVAERDNPDLFRSAANEAHRVAVTGLSADAVIYINTDRMNNLSIDQWVGLLAHESVHHLGLDDDARRLPDRVGAAVAAHFMANLQTGNMAEFGHSTSALHIFNDPVGDRPARLMGTALVFTVDQNATPNPRVPICADHENFKGQTIAAPLWRVMYLRGDKKVAKIRGSAHVTNNCIDRTSLAVRTVHTNFSVLMDLNFAETFDATGPWWEKPSKIDAATLVAGNNDGEEERLDLFRTFAIQSISHEKLRYLPGEAWQSRLVVESTDGFVPTNCSGYFNGAQWFFHRNTSTTMFEFFDSCVLTPLGGNQWQVDVKLTFPIGAQPDAFALAFVYFSGLGDGRFAIPSRPNFVQLNNATAPPRLSGLAWRVSGLESRDTIYGKPLKNSYRVKVNEPFWLEVDFTGAQEFKRQYFDFDFLVEHEGTELIMPWNPPLENISHIVLKTERVAIPGSGVRMRYQMVLPPVVSTVKTLGFKLRRLSVETGDFTWTDFEFSPLSDFLNAMFLTDAVER